MIGYRNLKIFQIIFGYYIIYGIVCAAGNVLIKYPSINIEVYIYCIIYILSITLGAYIGDKAHLPKINSLNLISIEIVLFTLAFVVFFSTVYTWYLVIKEFGLMMIIMSPNAVRYEMIGQEVGIIPQYVSYPNSLAFVAFNISLSCAALRGERKFKVWAVYFFMIIFITGLSTFSRNGILYAVFCFFGFFIVFKIKNIFSLKTLLLLLLIFFILSAPRMLRREGPFVFEDLDEKPRSYIKYRIPPLFNELLDTYLDYCSSIYALDDYFNNHNGEYTLGNRMFTPIVRILNKFEGEERINTLDENASNLPFEHNVYSIIRDLYSDFGIYGVSILSIFIGFFFGVMYNFEGVVYDAIRIYLFGWLFYTPIYNAYSFGGFVISLALLFIFCIIVKDKSLNVKKCQKIRNI